MDNVILKIENVSKQYRLGTLGTGTISHDLNRWWSTIRGKEDPYLKIGETNDRASKGNSEYVFSLKNIDFEVNKGEVLGIIGRNGAGKSTLLKVLSKVTGPSTGVIKTKGRIASLLEVGTGFHPEMTGKENIYLNGAILGMSKKEISLKIDEIVSFSGCERYIDTPVKRYSSGMKVRLAFAVAAFLEPDILIVDEVLAVGDVEFQKKAIGKMQDISSSGGRTVLFVSHSMESIMLLCTKIMVLNNGEIDYYGDVSKGISRYLSRNSEKIIHHFPIKKNGIQINSFKIINNLEENASSFILGESIKFQISISNINIDLKKINVKYQIFDNNEVVISTVNAFHKNEIINLLSMEEKEISCEIPKINFSPSKYFLGLELVDIEEKKNIYSNKHFSEFEVVNGDFFKTGKLPSKQNMGKILLDPKWTYTK